MSVWKQNKNDYTMSFDDFRIVVHRHIDYPKDQWLCSVYGDISIDKVELSSKDPEDAKDQALCYLEATLNNWHEEVRSRRIVDEDGT